MLDANEMTPTEFWSMMSVPRLTIRRRFIDDGVTLNRGVSRVSLAIVASLGA